MWEKWLLRAAAVAPITTATFDQSAGTRTHQDLLIRMALLVTRHLLGVVAAVGR